MRAIFDRLPLSPFCSNFWSPVPRPINVTHLLLLMMSNTKCGWFGELYRKKAICANGKNVEIVVKRKLVCYFWWRRNKQGNLNCLV